MAIFQRSIASSAYHCARHSRTILPPVPGDWSVCRTAGWYMTAGLPHESACNHRRGTPRVAAESPANRPDHARHDHRRGCCRLNARRGSGCTNNGKPGYKLDGKQSPHSRTGRDLFRRPSVGQRQRSNTHHGRCAAIATCLQSRLQLRSSPVRHSSIMAPIMEHSCSGVTPDYFEVRDWGTESGALFPKGFAVRYPRRPSGTIDAGEGKTCSAMKIPQKNVRIKNSPFVVAGRTHCQGPEPGRARQDDAVFIPLTTGQRQVFGNQFRHDTFHDGPGHIGEMMDESRSRDEPIVTPAAPHRRRYGK